MKDKHIIQIVKKLKNTKPIKVEYYQRNEKTKSIKTMKSI